MRGYRFYQELVNKNRVSELRTRKVVAVCLQRQADGYWGQRFVWPSTPNGGLCVEAISSLFDEDNSPVTYGAVSLDFLRDNCRRISEAEARELHPEMFVYLDR